METPTPCLILDAARVRRNHARLATYAAAHGLRLRPHAKTHKSLEIAALQLGTPETIGLTVAKCGEAEVMAAACGDLLVAYPVVDEQRSARLAVLTRDHTIRMAFDSEAAAAALSSSASHAGCIIGALVDLDVGFHRTGVQSAAAALQLAQVIERFPGLRLDGLMIYPGHIGGPSDEQVRDLAQVDAILSEVMDRWRRLGLPLPIVSGGSTPTVYQSHLIKGQTEIRSGTYIFQDMNGVHGGYAALDDCAATVLCTVVSNAVPGQVVIDAGSKTLTSDRCWAALDSGFGHVVEYPTARIVKLTEEHGQIDIRDCDRAPLLGERIHVIPNHICPCVNLHQTSYWQEPGEPPRLLRIDARGMVI